MLADGVNCHALVGRCDAPNPSNRLDGAGDSVLSTLLNVKGMLKVSSLLLQSPHGIVDALEVAESEGALVTALVLVDQTLVYLGILVQALLVRDHDLNAGQAKVPFAKVGNLDHVRREGDIGWGIAKDGSHHADAVDGNLAGIFRVGSNRVRVVETVVERDGATEGETEEESLLPLRLGSEPVNLVVTRGDIVQDGSEASSVLAHVTTVDVEARRVTVRGQIRNDEAEASVQVAARMAGKCARVNTSAVHKENIGARARGRLDGLPDLVPNPVLAIGHHGLAEPDVNVRVAVETLLHCRKRNAASTIGEVIHRVESEKRQEGLEVGLPETSEEEGEYREHRRKSERYAMGVVCVVREKERGREEWYVL